MDLPQIGTVAFVIAVVAFFSTQFKLQGNAALVGAFLVALIFNLAPLFAEAYPTARPFIEAVLKTILLTISAAGSYDFITQTVKKINFPYPPVG